VSVQGTPVYVFRAASELDYLVLTLLLRRLGLPVPRVHHPSFLLVPSATRWFDKLAGKLVPDRQNAIAHAVSRVLRGQCAYAALLPTIPLWQRGTGNAISFTSAIRIENVGRKRSQYRFRACRHHLEQKRRPHGRRTADLRRLLGDPEIPGRLRGLVQAASSLGRPVLKVAKTLELSAWPHLSENLPASEKARLLVHELDSRIEKEWRLQLGPKLPALTAIQRELARNPEVISAYYQAIRDGMNPQQARRELRMRSARFRPLRPRGRFLYTKAHSR
jgi:hypothetical protein